MCNKIDRIGEINISRDGYEMKIIEYFDNKNSTVKIQNTILYNIPYNKFKKGLIKNPYHNGIYNVGYIGEGPFKSSINNITTEEYAAWMGMLRRCYCPKALLRKPTYIDCTVDKKWHNFQNFAEWFNNNYIKGYSLDKDILFKGNKIYSENNCCFVPLEINNLFVKSDGIRGKYPIGVRESRSGLKYIAEYSKSNKTIRIGTYNTILDAFNAYKIKKENYIKEIADKYKPHIQPNVYNIMYNYKVDIKD